MEKPGISKFVDPEEMKSSAWSRRRETSFGNRYRTTLLELSFVDALKRRFA